MTRNIRAIIFDVDGVLVDSEQTHFKAYQKILAEYGQELSWPGYKKYFSGKSIKGGIAAFVKDHSITQATEFEKFLTDFSEKKIASTTKIFANRIDFFTDTVKFIKKVSVGQLELKDIGNINEKPIIAFTTGMEDGLMKEVMKHHNLNKLISVAITPSHYKRSKPDPESYLVTLGKIGISASEAIGIEDSPAGIDALNAAGIFSISLTTTHTDSELSKAKVIVSNLSELIL